MKKEIIVSILLLSSWLSAATLSLNPTVDTRVLMSAPDNNYDTGVELSTYNNGVNVQRTLMKFDLSSLAVGSTLTSASLNLRADTTYGANASGVAINVYRVTQDWVSSQATWNNATSGVTWTNAGVDAVGTTGAQLLSPYASYTANPTDGSTISWDVTSLVNQWYTGAQQNYGLLIISEASGSYLQYGSIESAYPPSLSINYTAAVPESSTYIGLVLGIIFAAFQLKRVESRNKSHQITA